MAFLETFCLSARTLTAILHFLAGFHRERPDLAIEIAARSGLRLKIAARSIARTNLLETTIRPMVADNLTWSSTVRLASATRQIFLAGGCPAVSDRS
jgi:hypothetical protein